ncbi:uncharacterized protein LOC129231490 [Uloborus diversus]|uniref:uncharacterized protein LOC129231490 n=1 Tax=Uloborus diversus TaxID=327109 RepID=UPI0024092C53|nr:uncharacterized protein LOC129231490 [Uloborus diversus]
MPELNTFCCWKTVKSGAYACALYTLIFYTALFIAGVCHAQTVSSYSSMFGFCLVMVVLSAVCIICSVILIVGLYKDNRYLLLPWTVAVAMTTLIDVMVSFYLIRDAITEPFLAVLFVTDVLICAVNVYALLCVLSQYQEYKIGLVRENVVQPRDQEAPREPPPKAPVTSSVTDEVNSSHALLNPSAVAPKISLAGPSTSAGKMVYCELTTISEEMHCQTPVAVKEMQLTSFSEQPTNNETVETDVKQTSEL